MARFFHSGILEQTVDELNITSETRKPKAANVEDLPDAKRKATDHSGAEESTNDTEADSADWTAYESAAGDISGEVEEKDGGNENEDEDQIAEQGTASNQKSDTTPQRERI